MAEETRDRLRVAPQVCSFTDDDHRVLTIEFEVPGVNSDEIQLRIHDDSLALRAPRDDFDYVTTLSLCCPVQPDKATATYRNGLLRLEVPFKDPMEDAVRVPIT